MLHSIKIFQFNSTDSTNLRAREYVLTGGALPALFTARAQTAGRGRRGRSFYSPKDSGLYMTLALPWDEALKNNVTLTTAVSVALVRSLSKHTEKSLSIKWINDIFADGKKTAGILCESVAEPTTGEVKAVIIGVGINLTTTDFPDDIGQDVTCICDKPLDREAITKELTEELFNVIYFDDKAELMNEYRQKSAVIGKDIYYIKDGEKFDALVLGIDDFGGLEVVHPDCTKTTLRSGEITLRIKPE